MKIIFRKFKLIVLRSDGSKVQICSLYVRQINPFSAKIWKTHKKMQEIIKINLKT